MAAVGRRRPDRHGVRPVPPDRHGVAAVGAGHPRHRGRARRRRGAAQLRGQAVHVRLHPAHVRGRDGRHRGGGRPLVRRPHQQPPPARAAAARRGGPVDQLRGEGGPGQPARRRLPRHRHPAAAPSTSAGACPRCTTSSWSWPASTSRPSPWRSGPTCHYIMGGVRVDADTEATTVPGLFAAGEVAGGHARRQPPRRQLAVGPPRLRPPGRHRRASDFAEGRAGAPAAADGRGRRRGGRGRRRRSSATSGESPYDIQHDLQETMQELVGIIRTESELTQAARASSTSSTERCRQGVGVRAAAPTTRGGTWPPTCPPC